MALLEARHLTKTYRDTQAVRDVSFQIEEGHCVALLGPNGAGKTTTLKMLAGLIQPTDGQLLFNGKPAVDIRAEIGYLPQNPGFHEWMSGREFLIYVGQLAGLRPRDAIARTDTMLEQLGLMSAAKRAIRGYSGGMKQRLGICQALIHQPKLLILDEPVSALDPVGRREILKLLADIRKDTTVLYSTHVLHDAEEISDDVLILSAGKLVISGSMAQLRKRHQHVRITLTAETSLESFQGVWLRLNSALRIETEGNQVRLTVTDLTSARNEILQTVITHQIPVVRMEFGSTTLEDLFMEAVFQ